MGCGVSGTPPRAWGCWLSSAVKAFEVRAKAQSAVNDGNAPIGFTVGAVLAAAPCAIASNILGIGHFPACAGLKLFFCHHGVFLSGLSAITLLRVVFCHKCTLLRVNLSSTFFEGLGFPRRGKFFLTGPRMALIYLRCSGIIRVAADRSGYPSGGDRLGGFSGCRAESGEAGGELASVSRV